MGTRWWQRGLYIELEAWSFYFFQFLRADGEVRIGTLDGSTLL